MEQEQHKKSVLHSFDHGKNPNGLYLYVSCTKEVPDYSCKPVSKHKSNLE